MGLGIVESLVGIAALLLAIYYYFTSNHDFWQNRGVKGPKPSLLFGNIRDVLLRRIHLCEYLTRLYHEYENESMFGIFERCTPVLIVKDTEHIKSVLIKDFSVFCDRGMIYYDKIEPLSQNLLFLEPERWRPLRVNLSPVFTSGRLKEMFYLLMGCAEHFEKFLDTIATKNAEIECRDLTAKFTTDVIGVCSFGLKMNALAEEESEFRKAGRKFFEITRFKLLKLMIRECAPWLYKLLGSFMYDYRLNDFFINSMKETMEYRKNCNVKRNDFVDLLLEIRDNPDKINHIGESFFFLDDEESVERKKYFII